LQNVINNMVTIRKGKKVKKGVHPEYKETTIVCACGNVIHTRSTKENIHVEICSKCHPFYTGKQKLVDSAGMVERFQKRYGKKKAAKPEAEEKTA
jgi:large subunit ribosomal protein L31